MEELLEKINNLENALDKMESVKEIKRLNEEIKKDEVLISLIEEYKKYPSDELKYKIYQNPLYQKYKERETDINILIFEINRKLKTITNKKGCI